MAAQITLSATSTDSTSITITWSSTYDYIELQYKTIYISWTSLGSSFASSDNYDQMVISNIVYSYKARGTNDGGVTWSDWAAIVTCASWAEDVSKSFLLSGTSTDIISSTAYSDTVSATINFSGFSLDAGSISTAYAYYFGDSAGKIYEHSDDYEGDAGSTIPCEWQGKETNFVDQFKELESRYKVIHFARLYYVDKSSNVSTTIKISTDGGVTWSKSATKTIGTGDGKNKSADFFFQDGPVSAQFITPKIESNTADKELQWTALALYFDPGAEDFSI